MPESQTMSVLRRASVFLLMLAAPANAGQLICMGTAPGFMSVIEDGSGSFDYLGDGRYSFEPALTQRPTGFQRLTMKTMRETWDVFVTEEACPLLTIETNISIEFAVPTSAGDRPMKGCCIWKEE
ncbi:MAG: hypothetical protein AAFR53_07345 [Pseudomonadota bacterium]